MMKNITCPAKGVSEQRGEGSSATWPYFIYFIVMCLVFDNNIFDLFFSKSGHF